MFWSKAPTGDPTTSLAETRSRREADASSGCRYWKAIRRRSCFGVFVKVRDDNLTQLLNARGSVDAHAQVRAAVDAFRIPRTQRTEFVDHPALTAPRLTRFDVRDMAETV